MSFASISADEVCWRSVEQPHRSRPCPSVTVIVPALDRVDNLDDCLAAIGCVDYPADRLEVIVVDDGSTDAAARGAGR